MTRVRRIMVNTFNEVENVRRETGKQAASRAPLS
jgi:hypothetical protein